MKKVYIANDGKEFESAKECSIYEIELSKEKDEEERKLKALVKRLRDLSTDMEFVPLTEHVFNSDIWYFRWFKVNNSDDYEFIRDISDGLYSSPKNYPAYICIVSEGDLFDYPMSAVWGYTLSDNIDEAKGFFAHFGYDCVITRRENND